MNTATPGLKEALVLSDDKIHVFLYQLNLYKSSDLMQHLSKDEQDRARKLKIQDKREQFVITRGLFRLLLSSSLKKEPHDIDISYLQHGKPITNDSVNNKTIEFNISHSGNYALIAMTLENKIGVDIEQINPDIDYLPLAKRFFSDKEKTELLRLDKEQQRATFYRIWARKESFIKATGKGIAFGLDRFSVPIEKLGDEAMEIITSTSTEDNWFCYNLMDPGNCTTALTSCKKHNDIVIYYQ